MILPDYQYMMDEDDFLMHVGTPHEGIIPHSGRFAYGSGENPYQRSVDFWERVQHLKATRPGITDAELAAEMGVYNRTGVNRGKPSSTEFRKKLSAATQMRREYLISEARKYSEQGLNNVQIGEKMGVNESVVRNWLKEGALERANVSEKTADVLKKFVDENRYVDIGPGVEIALGVSEGRLKSAVALLEEQGYQRQFLQIDQMGTDHKTTLQVLTPPDVDYAELSENRFDIKFPNQMNKTLDANGDVTRLGLGGKIQSVDSSRIYIDYESPSDGLMELRRGVPDISLGPKNYAQVRIGVDDTHYLKGMAVPSDKVPEGYDIIFHTNKKPGTPMMSDDPDAKQVLKPMKVIKDKDGNVLGVDWDNPFGASIDLNSDIMRTTRNYIGKDGKEHLSAINVVREEGDWMHWDKNLASQYLSKMPLSTAERQLGLTSADKRYELDEIKALDNPTVKKHLLIAYADKCDALAVELKAAPFKGQQTHVLLPDDRLGDNEIYAPGYKDGTRVALVRYPFTGPFESPELTVRNTGSPSQDIIPMSSPDAVCINKKRLDQMSGADCDGDTALVIPITDKVKVRTSKETLKDLKNFDPHSEYEHYEGMPRIKHQTQQTEMGKVTNLITDMYLQNAPEADLAKAVKHSMVIIDAEKHYLDWKRSEKENQILELKQKYQADAQGRTGAGTIISRAGSDKMVDQRKDWRASPASIDEEGNKIYKYTESKYTEGKLNLKGIILSDGRTVNLSVDKDEGLYFTRRVPGEKKSERVYVSDKDLPERLRGVDIKSSGWVNLSHDKTSDRDYYIQKDPATNKGVRVYVNDGDIVETKDTLRQQKSTKMAEEPDAYKLTSGGSKEYPGHPMEKVYAEFANNMKDLAREARREWLRTGSLEYDPDAYKKYKPQVDSLNSKLKEALSNAPYERQAQLLANRTMAIKKFENPNMSKDEKKKKKGQAINAARTKLGSKKKQIEITDEEYEAIRAGAITESKLKKIMDNADIDSLRAQATPKARRTITPNMEALAKSMAATGATQAEIADRLGISKSSVYEIIKG